MSEGEWVKGRGRQQSILVKALLSSCPQSDLIRSACFRLCCLSVIFPAFEAPGSRGVGPRTSVSVSALLIRLTFSVLLRVSAAAHNTGFFCVRPLSSPPYPSSPLPGPSRPAATLILNAPTTQFPKCSGVMGVGNTVAKTCLTVIKNSVGFCEWGHFFFFYLLWDLITCKVAENNNGANNFRCSV